MPPDKRKVLPGGRGCPPIGADYSVREIVDHLTGNAVALCHFLLPNGQREGSEGQS